MDVLIYFCFSGAIMYVVLILAFVIFVLRMMTNNLHHNEH